MNLRPIHSSGKSLALMMVVVIGFIPVLKVRSEMAPNWQRICDIQGGGKISPMLGKDVTTRGIVHADLDDTAQRGFFLQHADCDQNKNTSDGIFIYLGEEVDQVMLGDLVEATGIVEEYYGFTRILSLDDQVVILSHGNSLPPHVELSPPFDNPGSELYFESLESMRVGMQEAVVVGPTNSDDQTWLVDAELGISRIFANDPQGTGEIICVDDRGLYEITPEAKVGDVVTNLSGVLEYSLGIYCMQLFDAPILKITARNPAVSSVPDEYSTNTEALTIGTFNLAGLFDTVDDPDTEDDVISASEYQRRLQKRAITIHSELVEPALVALQEAENMNVLLALRNRPEIEKEYSVLIEDGPDQRGLDTAYLYLAEKLQVLNFETRQGCTKLIDGLGPDGNLDMQFPENSITCDSNSDGILDGNRLFSRPPSLVQFELLDPGNRNHQHNSGDIGWQENKKIWVINNHLVSKIYDQTSLPYSLPRRLEQAAFVVQLVRNLRTINNHTTILVLGDLNDGNGSKALEMIEGEGFNNLWNMNLFSDRYSYNYHGLSQALDHVLVSTSPDFIPTQFRALHTNSDFPAEYEKVNLSIHRASDHDPLVATLQLMDHFFYLAMIIR